MQVYVARYCHRHGTDLRVFATEQSADQWRKDLAAQWWNTEMLPDHLMPADPEKATEKYWEVMEDRDEYLTVECVDVE